MIKIIIKIIRVNNKLINDKSYKIIPIIIILVVIAADIKDIVRVIKDKSIILITIKGNLIIKIIIILNNNNRLN